MEGEIREELWRNPCRSEPRSKVAYSSHIRSLMFTSSLHGMRLSNGCGCNSISPKDLGNSIQYVWGEETCQRMHPLESILDLSKRGSDLASARLYTGTLLVASPQGVEDAPDRGEPKTPFWVGCSSSIFALLWPISLMLASKTCPLVPLNQLGLCVFRLWGIKGSTGTLEHKATRRSQIPCLFNTVRWTTTTSIHEVQLHWSVDTWGDRLCKKRGISKQTYQPWGPLMQCSAQDRQVAEYGRA